MSLPLQYSFQTLNHSISSYDLLEVQKVSYDAFLHGSSFSSLRSLVESFFPVVDHYEYSRLEFVDLKIIDSSFSEDFCITKNKSYVYTVNLVLRLILFKIDQLSGEKTIRSIKEQQIYFCDIPKMTKSCSFIVSGIVRSAVSQLHRAQGVLFEKKFDTKISGFSYSAIFVPYLGSRIDFTLLGSDLFLSINKSKKIDLISFLKAIEISSEEILSFFYSFMQVYKSELKDFYKIEISSDFNENITPIDLYDLNGKILFKKGSIFFQKTLSSEFLIKDLSKFYIVDSSDFLCELSSNFFENNSLFNVVNIFEKKFSSIILNGIIVNKDISFEDCVFNVYQKIEDVSSGDNIEILQNKLKLKFFNTSFLNFFEVGRYKLNKELNLNIDHTTGLTKEDILYAIKKLINIMKFSIKIPDVDSMINRRIKSVGELIENNLRSAFSRIIKISKDKLSTEVLDVVNLSDIINGNSLTKIFISDFVLNELIQFSEQTNHFAEIAHKRRISAAGPGGIQSQHAVAATREVHFTQYNKICPVETSDGNNIGLISSFTYYSRTNKYGFIESPYFSVKNCNITDEIVYLNASDELKYKICQINPSFIKDRKIIAEYVPVRYNSNFLLMKSTEVDFVDISPKQLVSLGCNLIPFFDHNDAARTLMGANMQRQAVPLIFAESPVVSTGVESDIINSLSDILKSDVCGIVDYVDSSLISIKTSDNNIKLYHLKNFRRSNQNTMFQQKPIVLVNQKIQIGDLLAITSCIDNEMLSLGKNVLVAFMPWRGFNYEDSIIVSEDLIKNDTFTSIHVFEFEVIVRDTKLGEEKLSSDIPDVAPFLLRHLDESGIVRLGSEVKQGDFLVGKLTPKAQAAITSEERLLNAVFNTSISEYTNTSLRSEIVGTIIDIKILTQRGVKKIDTEIESERLEVERLNKIKSYELNSLSCIFSDKLKEIHGFNDLESDSFYANIKNISLSSPIYKKVLPLKTDYEKCIKEIETKYFNLITAVVEGDDLGGDKQRIIKISVASKSSLQPGDKMSGRHGNKGVISRVLKREDMPFMDDGTPVDMILNSFGVPGRMNIGQILETNLGLASFGLSKKIQDKIDQNEAISNIRSLLLNLSFSDNFSKYLKSLSDESLMSSLSLKNKIIFQTPIFDGAKITDIEKMLVSAGFDKSGQVMLRDGYTGEYFERPVTVGLKYMMKLHHLVDDKVHARSIGPYSLVTQQPLGGKSHFGAQRFGEMEVWALEAYGAAYTLREMLTIKSDDVFGRNAAYQSIVNNESILIDGIPESLNILIKELNALGLDIEMNIDRKIK